MTSLSKIFITSFLSVFLFNPSFAENLSPSLQNYIQSLKKYDFNPAELTQLFQKVHIDFTLIDKMNRPAEKLTWPRYRKLFITEQRIQQGLKFWKEHESILRQAEKKYGVPANIIVAMLGVETNYGQIKGSYRVMDSLSTFSFYYKPREKFFQQELTEYLLMTREQKLDPLKLTGSYAGAIGIPQFMPSAYRKFAVDYSQEGSADLVNDVNDAIFSMANFLEKKGWQAQQKIADPLLQSQAIQGKLISLTAEPTHSLALLQKYGISIPQNANKKTKASIIKLDSDEADARVYWLAFANFRAIMHYNPRINYAMAVYQLSEEIKNVYEKRTAIAKSSGTPTKRAFG